MFALYIIQQNTNGIYKIGVHTGSKKALISRYITAIPNVCICEFFIYMSKKVALVVETSIKQKYHNMRISNVNDNLSEWFTLDKRTLNEIIYYAESFIAPNLNKQLNIINHTGSMTDENKENSVYITEMITYSIAELQDLYVAKLLILPDYQRPIENHRIENIKLYIVEKYNTPEFYLPEVVL